MAAEPSTAPAAVPANDAAFARITWRLLPFLFVLYVLCFLNRASLSLVKTELGAGLKIDEKVWGDVYSWAYGIFFVGYLIFEVPSNLIMLKVGARRWIARIMITWGIISSAIMFVTGPNSLYTMRFLLGIAEAGFFPGIIFYLASWYPARRRARAMAMFIAAAPIGQATAGLLSGWLLKLHGLAGIDGWQWVLLITGLPTIIFGFWTLFYLDDKPEDAKWLSDDARAAVVAEIAVDRASGPPSAHLSFVQSLTHPTLWLLTAMYFVLMICFYAMTSYLPSIYKESALLAGWGDVGKGTITAIPYLCAASLMVPWGRRSDRHGERRWHCAGPVLVAACAITGAAFAGSSPLLLMILLGLTAAAMNPVMSPFWSLTNELLRGTAAAGGVAMINSIGCLGGLFGPKLINQFMILNPDGSKDYTYSFLGVAACFVIFAGLVLYMRHRPAARTAVA